MMTAIQSTETHMKLPPGRAADVVVFDLGGVLVDWNPRYLYRQLFDGDEASMERFLADVCTQTWNEQQDAGRAWEEAIAEAIAAHPHHAEMIKAYYDRWEEMLAGSFAGTVAILDELRRTDLRLFALTNWSQHTFPRAIDKFDFFAWFEDIIVSGKEGIIKPDPAIFRILTTRFGVDPARAVFIDDSWKNVDAAARLGFRALQFRNAEALRVELVALGLLPMAGSEVPHGASGP